jgi:hypothetical protein
VKLGFAYPGLAGVTAVRDGSNAVIGARITHVTGGETVVDKFTNYESFAFSDGTRTLPELFNTAPRDRSGLGSGDEDGLIAVTLTGSDADGNLTGFRILDLPARGTLYTGPAPRAPWRRASSSSAGP